MTKKRLGSQQARNSATNTSGMELRTVRKDKRRLKSKLELLKMKGMLKNGFPAMLKKKSVSKLNLKRLKKARKTSKDSTQKQELVKKLMQNQNNLSNLTKLSIFIRIWSLYLFFLLSLVDRNQ